MFKGTSSFNQPLDSWDVSLVSNMQEAFADSIFNQPLSSWDVGSTRQYRSMFQNSFFNQNLCPWMDKYKATGVTFYTTSNNVFAGSACPDTSDPDYNLGPWCYPCQQSCFASRAHVDSALRSDYNDPTIYPYIPHGPIKDWCFGPSADNFNSLFWGLTWNDDIGASDFNDDISGWDVSLGTYIFERVCTASDTSTTQRRFLLTKMYLAHGTVTDFSYMFVSLATFNQDISLWDVSSGTYFEGIFNRAESFNGDISSWDVGAATDLSWAFDTATDFNRDISSWDVSSVITFRSMFDDAPSFNQDISGWEVHLTGTDFEGMFLVASSFNQNLCSWAVAIAGVGSTPIFSNMFSGTSCPSATAPSNPIFDDDLYDDFCYTCN